MIPCIRRKIHTVAVLFATAFLLFGYSSFAAAADPVADFYAGKQIRLIIGFAAGGGYDLYSRAIAQFMEKHIPGNPKIVPQNMEGAGTRVAANYLYNVAPRDGTAIGSISQSTASDQVLGEQGIQFEADKFNWIGNPIVDNNVTIVTSDTNVVTIDDLIAKSGTIVCGSTGASTASAIYPRALNGLLGTNMRVLIGYPGGTDIILAMDRGELNCRSGNSWSSTRATAGAQLAARKLNVILQWGPEKNPDIAAYMGHDVPLASGLAKTDIDRAAIGLLTSDVAVGRPLMAPPGVPAERVAALRRAFDETMKDPDFLAMAAKAKLDILPLSGEKVQDIVASVVRTPPAAIARTKELIQAKDTK